MGIAEEENENEKEDEIVVEENENVENIAKETSDDDSANESMEEDEVSGSIFNEKKFLKLRSCIVFTKKFNLDCFLFLFFLKFFLFSISQKKILSNFLISRKRFQLSLKQRPPREKIFNLNNPMNRKYQNRIRKFLWTKTKMMIPMRIRIGLT